MTALWKLACLLTAPLLSFLYAATAAVFLASWRENPWNEHVTIVVSRLSLLAVVVAVCWAKIQDITTPVVIIVSVALTSISSNQIQQTYIHVVRGGPHPALGDMTDKVVVITGANTGIGKETARLLVQQGATVVMACRSVDKAQAAKADILRAVPDGSVDEARLHVLYLDLSKLASVREAATQLANNKKFDKIDVIINNAGVMMNKPVTTQDGYEMVMQANHLGHFLWTRLLLEKLADNGRILCLTSSTYSYAPRIDLEDLFCTKGRKFTLFGQYAQSKLANILFVKELAKRTSFFVAAVHPGLVRTDVVRNMPWYLKYPNIIFGAFLAALQKTPEGGAWCSAYLASVDHTSDFPSGEYWVNQRVQTLWPCALDLDGAKQLWLDSERYVKWEGSDQ